MAYRPTPLPNRQTLHRHAWEARGRNLWQCASCLAVGTDAGTEGERIRAGAEPVHQEPVAV